MNPNTGNIVVDGVVQIAVAHLTNTKMDNDRVPDFLKQISKSLIECIQEADTAISATRGSTEAPTQAAAPVTAKAPAPVTEKAPPAAAPAAQAPVSAAPAAAAPVAAAAPAETAVAIATPKQRKTRAKATTAQTVSESAKTAAPELSVDTVQDNAPQTEVVEVVAEAQPDVAPYAFAHISRKPFVSVKKSVKPDYIVCLIDGERRKMMTRHLRSKYNMSEAEYKAHFNLDKDYPMVAPSYSKEKSLVAKNQGLGTAKLFENTQSSESAKATPATSAKVTTRKRKAKAEAAA